MTVQAYAIKRIPVLRTLVLGEIVEGRRVSGGLYSYFVTLR